MEKITPKQLEIILLLYRFRFLNRRQIQQLLHHKDPRRINAWLKDLTQRNIIGRKYSNKLLENTKPAIYHLATKSRQILLNQPAVNEKLLKRVYREKIRSERLINHCLLIADLYLRLIQQTANQTLHFFTKTDLSTHYYLPYHRPDAYIAIQGANATKRYFLEVIDPGSPRFMLRQKIEQYIDYYNSRQWQEYTNHLFPNILLLCPDENLKNYLQKFISQKLEEEPEVEIDFYLSLAGDIERVGWEKVG